MSNLRPLDRESGLLSKRAIAAHRGKVLLPPGLRNHNPLNSLDLLQPDLLRRRALRVYRGSRIVRLLANPRDFLRADRIRLLMRVSLPMRCMTCGVTPLAARGIASVMDALR